jgi:hypothetical protein
MLLNPKKNAYRLHRLRGTLQRETFAVKSMQDNSNLLRLKLDMVYRDLPTEVAQQKFKELTEAREAAPVAAPVIKVIAKRKKLVKAVPGSK